MIETLRGLTILEREEFFSSDLIDLERLGWAAVTPRSGLNIFDSYFYIVLWHSCEGRVAIFFNTKEIAIVNGYGKKCCEAESCAMWAMESQKLLANCRSSIYKVKKYIDMQTGGDES